MLLTFMALAAAMKPFYMATMSTISSPVICTILTAITVMIMVPWRSFVIRVVARY